MIKLIDEFNKEILHITDPIDAFQTTEVPEDFGLPTDTLDAEFILTEGELKLLDGRKIIYGVVPGYSSQDGVPVETAYRITRWEQEDLKIMFESEQAIIYEMRGHLIHFGEDEVLKSVTAQKALQIAWDKVNPQGLKAPWKLDFPTNVGRNYTREASEGWVSIFDFVQDVVNYCGLECRYEANFGLQGKVEKTLRIRSKFGRKSHKHYLSGTNAWDVISEGDFSEVYTAILPTGVPSDGVDAEGTSIEIPTKIDDIVWSTASGHPLNKVKGAPILEDTTMTKIYGLDGSESGTKRPRILQVNYSTQSSEDLIRLAYDDLVRYSKPQIVAKAKLIDINEPTFLGDEIILQSETPGGFVFDRRERVIKIVRDLKVPELSEIYIGTPKLLASVRRIRKDVDDIKQKSSRDRRSLRNHDKRIKKLEDKLAELSPIEPGPENPPIDPPPGGGGVADVITGSGGFTQNFFKNTSSEYSFVYIPRSKEDIQKRGATFLEVVSGSAGEYDRLIPLQNTHKKNELDPLYNSDVLNYYLTDPLMVYDRDSTKTHWTGIWGMKTPKLASGEAVTVGEQIPLKLCLGVQSFNGAKNYYVPLANLTRRSLEKSSAVEGMIFSELEPPGIPDGKTAPYTVAVDVLFDKLGSAASVIMKDATVKVGIGLARLPKIYYGDPKHMALHLDSLTSGDKGFIYKTFHDVKYGTLTTISDTFNLDLTTYYYIPLLVFNKLSEQYLLPNNGFKDTTSNIWYGSNAELMRQEEVNAEGTYFAPNLGVNPFHAPMRFKNLRLTLGSEVGPYCNIREQNQRDDFKNFKFKAQSFTNPVGDPYNPEYWKNVGY